MRLACHRKSVITMPAIHRRMTSASPRWLPANRGGRCTLRMTNAVITPASTRNAKTSTSSAYQPCSPSQGSVACSSTMPIIAMRIVGSSTMKPQKIAACIRPGQQPLQELALSDHDDSLGAHAARQVVEAPGRLAHADQAVEQARRGARTARRRRRGRRASAIAGATLTVDLRISAEMAGHYLLQVADDRVVGVRHDRRLGVGVDGQDPLGVPAPRHVLRRAGDAARDVQVGRDLGPGLADLVRVRAPPGAGDHSRAADRAAQQAGQLLDDGEALLRARPRARR